jgi:hypothetical protein
VYGLFRAAQAAVDHHRQVTATTPRGSTRAKNDRSREAKATHFRSWLSLVEQRESSLVNLPQPSVIPLLGAYLSWVADINTLSGDIVSASTLCAYVCAAQDFLHLVLPYNFSINDPTKLTSSVLHPTLACIINDRRKWSHPKTERKRKRLPYSIQMLTLLNSEADAAAAHDPATQLDSLSAIRDWINLSIFTGSRISEYAQHTRSTVNRVPQLPDSGVRRPQTLPTLVSLLAQPS